LQAVRECEKLVEQAYLPAFLSGSATLQRNIAFPHTLFDVDSITKNNLNRMKLALFQRSCLLAAATGVLTALAGPPINFYFLAWIGLIPLFFALERPQGKGFIEGFIAGLAYGAGTLYWLAFNSGTYLAVATASMLAAVVILAVGWGLAACLFRLIYLRLGNIAWIAVPFSWTTWEGWLSHLGEVGFPWSLLALTQAGFNPILQVMEFTGIWGVSFWVATLNIMLFFIMKHPGTARKVLLISTVVWLVVPFVAMKYAYRYYDKNAPSVKVLIVQGSVDPAQKWLQEAQYSWTVYDSLSRAGYEADVELIIWPETAIPVDITRYSSFRDRITELASDLDAYILTGAPTRRKVNNKTRPLNTAYLIKPNIGTIDQYAKRWLVPFGERVPFQWIIPQLGNLNFGQAEFLPGQRQSIFEVSTDTTIARFPALICYESAFPQQTREAVQNGANLLVTISNDAWYGMSSEQSQIATLSLFRCIETRRSMARVSNAGISFLADPLGRVITKTKLYQPEWKAGALQLATTETFYVKYGNWFLFLVTMVYGGMLIRALFKRDDCLIV